MSASPIRLAFVGCPNDAVTWKDAAARLRGGCIEMIVDSLATALEEHETEFDAVIIGASLQPQPAAVCRAATAGKHVLVESPVAGSCQEAEEAIEACEQAGVQFGVFHTRRSTPGVQAIAERLAAGVLGEPGLLRVHRWASASARPLAPDPRRFPKKRSNSRPVISGYSARSAGR
jgi:predicted dehydrogenase